MANPIGQCNLPYGIQFYYDQHTMTTELCLDGFHLRLPRHEFEESKHNPAMLDRMIEHFMECKTRYERDRYAKEVARFTQQWVGAKADDLISPNRSAPSIDKLKFNPPPESTIKTKKLLLL